MWQKTNYSPIKRFYFPENHFLISNLHELDRTVYKYISVSVVDHFFDSDTNLIGYRVVGRVITEIVN